MFHRKDGPPYCWAKSDMKGGSGKLFYLSFNSIQMFTGVENKGERTSEHRITKCRLKVMWNLGEPLQTIFI